MVSQQQQPQSANHGDGSEGDLLDVDERISEMETSKLHDTSDKSDVDPLLRKETLDTLISQRGDGEERKSEMEIISLIVSGRQLEMEEFAEWREHPSPSDKADDDTATPSPRGDEPFPVIRAETEDDGAAPQSPSGS